MWDATQEKSIMLSRLGDFWYNVLTEQDVKLAHKLCHIPLQCRVLRQSDNLTKALTDDGTHYHDNFRLIKFTDEDVNWYGKKYALQYQHKTGELEDGTTGNSRMPSLSIKDQKLVGNQLDDDVPVLYLIIETINDWAQIDLFQHLTAYLGEEVVLYWGDGAEAITFTQETVTEELLTHTYAKSGVYTIGIYGGVMWKAVKPEEDTLKDRMVAILTPTTVSALFEVDNGVGTGLFAQYSQLNEVGDKLFSNLKSIGAKDLTNAFKDCPELTVVSYDLLAHLPDTEELMDYSSMFQGDGNVIDIPEWWNNAKLQNSQHQDCFTGCVKAPNYLVACAAKWASRVEGGGGGGGGEGGGEEELEEAIQEGLELVINVPSDNYTLDLSATLTSYSRYYSTAIDWGSDNHFTTLLQNMAPEEMRYTYPKKGQYTIRIYGAVVWGSAEAILKQITVIDAAGELHDLADCLIKVQLPTEKSSICLIRDREEGAAGIFSDCTQLSSVPINLFDNLQTHSIREFIYAFQNTAITTIYPEWFAGLAEQQDLGEVFFNNAFAKCTKLTQVPQTLFTAFFQWPKLLLHLNAMFYGCTGLTSVAKELLSTTNSSHTVWSTDMFRGCMGVTASVPDWWSVDPLEASPHTNCFTGCRKSPNYIFACVRGWAEDINNPGSGGDGEFAGGIPRLALHVTIPSDKYSLSVHAMTYENSDYTSVVDFGDGSDAIALQKYEAGDKIFLNKTYAKAGDYVINIYGEIAWFGVDATMQACLTQVDVPMVQKCAIRSYLNSGEAWFYGCSKLTSVTGKVFNNLDAATVTDLDLNNAFRSTGLTEVPAGLFNNIPDGVKTLDCEAMFAHCSQLVSCSPSALFGSFTQITALDCRNMFVGCSKLKDTIGRELFQSQSLVTNLDCSSMFNGCTSITNVALDNLFDNCPMLQTLICNYMFLGDAAIKGAVPSTLFSVPAPRLGHLQCMDMFSGCTGLTGEVKETLFSGFRVLQALYASNMFYGCTGITAINDGLLRGVGKLSSLTTLTLNSMFKDCSNVTGVCPDYWNTPSLEASKHANCYTGCTKTTNYRIACICGWAEGEFGTMTWSLDIPTDNYELDLSNIIERYSEAPEDPIIMWGDVAGEAGAFYLTSDSSSDVRKHTYKNAGIYVMRFMGQFTMRTRLDANGQLDVLTKILTKVETPGENGCIYRIENQGTTADHECGTYAHTNGIFFKCSKLTEVGENVFSNLTSFGDKANLGCAFEYTPIKKIYSKWLQHVPVPADGVLNLRHFFAGPHNATVPELPGDILAHLPSGVKNLILEYFFCAAEFSGAIPENLLASLPSTVTTLSCQGMFKFCDIPSGTIPAGLFKKLPTGVTTLTLTEMFSTTRTLHTIPGDLLSALPSGLKTLRCGTMFQNSDAITAVPSNLFSSLPQLTELNCQQMFQQCDGFTSIPDALLRSLPTSITTGNLNNMFNTCSMVGGDLPTWWDKPQLEGFPHKDCFTGCTKATNYMLAQVQGWASGVPDIGLNLTITTPSANFILDLSQRVARYSKATFDPVIDWGDGSEQTEITNLKHTYTAQGTYTVKIYGEIIWQKLATPITDDSKQDSLCKCLTRIDVPGSKCSIVDATNVAYAGWFAQCHLLATIPAKLFSNLKNVAAVNFDRAFHGTAISSIPAALFSGIPAALKPTTLSCAGTFCSCPNLSSIPEALFKGLPSTLTTVNLVNCFQTSPKITTVPATLFSYLPSGVKTLVLQGALMCGTASSGGLTAIPNTLLHKLPSGLTSFNMWALCWNQTQLRDVPADFFAKLPTGIKDLDIHRCFMNCKKLTTIPAALLTSIPSAVGIKDLTEMFRDCSAVTGTLPEYWNTAKLEAVTHTDFYTGCTKATNYATADAKGWATSNFSLTFTITPTASTLTIDLSKRIGTNAVNSTLDWGDGSAVVKIPGGNLKHTYATASTYTISIKGQIWLAAQASNKGDAFSQSLTAISTPTGMSSIVEVRAATAPDAGIFANCTKLTSIAANIFAMVTTNNMTIMQEPTLPIPEVATDSEEDVLAEVVIETVTLPLPEVDTMMEETPQLEVVPEEIIQDPIATLPEAEETEEETVVDLEPHGHIGEDGNAVLFRHGDKDVELADYATLHFSLRVDPDIKVTSIRTLSGRMLFEHQDFISRFGQLIFPQNPITLFPEMQFMAQSYDYRRRNVYCYPLGVDVYGQVDRILHYTRVSQSPKSLYLASAQAAGFPVVREDCEVLSVVPMHSGVIYYTTHGHYEAPFPHAHLPVGTHLKAGEVIAGNQLYRMVLPGDTLPGNVQYINLDYALPIRGLRAPNREIQVYTEPNQLRPEFEGNSTTLARYHRWLSKYDGTYDYSRHIPARMNAIELVRDYLCAGRCIIVCVNTYHITDEMYLRLDNFLRRELPLGSVLVTAPYHGLINEVESSWGAVVEPGPPPQQVPNGEDWPNGAPGSQGSGGQGGGGHYGDEEVEAPEGTYEFVIDQSQSDPDKMITYAGTNKKYTPAHINDSTGMLDYGDWEDSWLLQAFRPCMLHADGTVAYYLNPLDLSQKESGESAMSDLTSDTHDMNAMVEVGQIWIREVVEGANKFHVYIAPTKAKGFDCYTHYNEKNGMVDKYYFGMYKGSLDANRKIRSLSGKQPCTNYTGELQKEYCANNGAGWSCREWSFQRLMQYICLLLGKNANTQSVFGNGYWEGGKTLKTGGNELRGLFYGSTKNRTTHMTLLGMEDFWGNVSDLCNGLWNENGVYKVKLTPGTADGSEAPGYTDNTAAYTTLDVVPPVTTKCEYATQMMAVPGKGLFPTGAQGGSSALYYTDGINATKEGLAAARVGYGSPAEAVGAFALDVSAPITGFDAADGVTLSYKDAGVVSGGPSIDDGEDDSANGSIRFKLVTTEQNMEVDVSDWFYTNESGYHGIIDWGDGSFQTSIIPLQSKSELKHTYTTPGDYWLEVTGKVTMGDGKAHKETVLQKVLQEIEIIDECPVAKYNRFLFQDYTQLKSVTFDKLFSNHALKQSGSLDCTNMFNRCSNLTGSIPSGLFPEGIKTLNCGSFFADCTSLESTIPSHLFPSTLQGSLYAVSVFSECTKVTGEVPADLFPAGLTSITASQMFYKSGVTGIAEGFGANIPNTSAMSWSRCFQDAAIITTIPAFWETHQNTNHSYCFAGCNQAVNWREVPEDWGGDPPGAFRTIEFHIHTDAANTEIDLGDWFYTTETGVDATLDWGDSSSTTTIKTGQDKSTYKHTYATAGDYTITVTGDIFMGVLDSKTTYKIRDCLTRVEIPGDESPVLGFVAGARNTKQTSGVFHGCSKLTYVDLDKLFTHPFLTTRTTFSSVSMFTGCSSLATVQSGIFSKFTQLQTLDCQYMFAGCVALSGQLPTMFPATLTTLNCSGLIAQVSRITSLASGFFGNLTALTNLSCVCMLQQTGLTSVPGDLFSKMTNLQELSASQMFAGCTSLQGTLPGTLFSSNTKLVDLACASMFASCAKLIGSIPSTLFSSLTKLKHLLCYSMFQGCTELNGGISADLFTNLRLLEDRPNSMTSGASRSGFNCSYMFYGDTKLGGSAAIFPTTSGITRLDCTNMYYGTAITVISESLCTGLTAMNQVDFANTFYGCEKITGKLPELWKKYEATTGTHTDCFKGCVNATNWKDVPEDWGGDEAADLEGTTEHVVGDKRNAGDGDLLWWQWDKQLLPPGTSRLRRVSLHCRDTLTSSVYKNPVYLGVWDVYEPEDDVRFLGVSDNTQTCANGADLAFKFSGEIDFTSARSLRFLPLLQKEDKWYDPPTTVLGLKVQTVANHDTEPETYCHSAKNQPINLRVVGEIHYIYQSDEVEPYPGQEPDLEDKPESSRTDENGYTERVFSWYAGKGDKEDDPHYRGTGYVSVSGFAFRTSASPYFQEDWPYVRIPLELALPLNSQVTRPFRFVHYAWCWADSWKTTDWKYPSTPGAAVTGLKTYNPRTLKEITNLSYTEANNVLPCVPVQKNSKGQYFIDVPVYTKGLKWSGVLFGLGNKESAETQGGIGINLYLKADIFVPNAEVWEPGLTPDNSTSTYCPDLHMIVLSGDSTNDWGGLRAEGIMNIYPTASSYPATLPDVTLVNKTPGVNKWSGTENYNGLTADKNNNIFPVCENKDYATEEKAYYRGDGMISCDGFIIRTAALGELAKTANEVEMTITTYAFWAPEGTTQDTAGVMHYSWVVADKWQDGKYWQAPDAPVDAYYSGDDGKHHLETGLQQYNPSTSALIPVQPGQGGWDTTFEQYKAFWKSLPSATVQHVEDINVGAAVRYSKHDVTIRIPLIHPQTKKRLSWAGIKFFPGSDTMEGSSFFTEVYLRCNIFRPNLTWDMWLAADSEPNTTQLEEEMFEQEKVNIGSFGKAVCGIICATFNWEMKGWATINANNVKIYPVGIPSLRLHQ